MGYFRFRRSVKIAPGIRLNLNKNSTSVTFGKKGFHYTVNSKGTHTSSVGIPGTGLSYVETKKFNGKRKKTGVYDKSSFNNSGTDSNNTKNFSPDAGYEPQKTKKSLLCRTWFIVLMLFLVTPVGIFIMWLNTGWNAVIKIIVSILGIFYFSVLCAFF